MSNFKLKDFNKIVISGIDSIDEDGNFTEATSNFFKTDSTTYVLNPATHLLSKLSGLEFSFWNEYSFSWLNMNFPEVVLKHSCNHYRALALFQLLKEGVSVETFKKIINIIAGYPFTIFEGTCTDISLVGDSYIITQTIGSSSDTIQYKIPDYYTLNIAENQVLGFYEPLIEGISYKDYKDGFAWMSTFDNANIIPLSSVSNVDFALAKRRIVGVTVRKLSDVTFSGYFFEKILKQITPKDIILFIKFTN